MSHAGVYHSDNVLLENIPLILLNDLTDSPHNVFFKLFGSHQEAKLAAITSLKQCWEHKLTQNLLWLLDSLLKRWFKTGELSMDEVITSKTLIEEGKAWNKLLIQKTSPELLQELLQDNPFVHQLQTKAETTGQAKGEAIGSIIEALAIRFQAERHLWRDPLYQLSLPQLTELRQTALRVDSLSAFEDAFQAVQAD